MTFNQRKLQREIQLIDRQLEWSSKVFYLPSAFVCTATAEMELGVTAAWLARHRDINGGKLKELDMGWKEQVPGQPECGHCHDDFSSGSIGCWIDGMTFLQRALHWVHPGASDRDIKSRVFKGEEALGRTRTARQCLPLAWNLEAIRGHLLAESFAKEQQRR